LPFAGLHQLLQPLLTGLDGLAAAQRGAVQAAFGLTDAAAPDLFLIALATLDLLADAADRSPLLLIAEDAHWLDRPTNDVLAFVARRVSTEPIVLLLAVRDDCEDPFASVDVPELRLAPLDDASAGALLDAHAPDLAPAVRERLLDEGAGKPARAGRAGRRSPAALDGAAVLPDHLPLSARLERTFAARVSGLPDDTRTLLLVAAADGASVLAESLSAAELVRGEAVPVDALGPAISVRLVELDAAHVRFRHPLVRSAIYQAAGAPERLAALARVLAGQPDRSIRHRAAATVGRDEEVAAALEAAASRAERRGAIAVAASAVRRAAELGDHGVRAGRLLRAAELAFELGPRDLVGRLLREAEPLELGPLERARATWTREMIAPRVITEPAAVDAPARHRRDDGRRARAGGPAAGRLVTHPRAQGRLGHLARMLVLRAWVATNLGDWRQAMPAAEEAGRLAAETGERFWAVGATTVEAVLVALRGDGELAEALAGEVEAVALPAGASFMLSAVQMARGATAPSAGRRGEAYGHLRRLFDPADPSHHPLMCSRAIGDLAEAAIHSDQRDDARARSCGPRARRAAGGRGGVGPAVAAGAPDRPDGGRRADQPRDRPALYLSHRTVGSHLYRLFPKLGITSR